MVVDMAFSAADGASRSVSPGDVYMYLEHHAPGVVRGEFGLVDNCPLDIQQLFQYAIERHPIPFVDNFLDKTHYRGTDDFLQLPIVSLLKDELRTCERPPLMALGARGGVHIFTTLNALVLCRALQTFRATRSTFTTLLAELRVEVTHGYARSLYFYCADS